mgnify:FL=1|tara:strand:- start:217 stop:594 length:378 start_codon:yes stop_codon:yes gene_type:complete
MKDKIKIEHDWFIPWILEDYSQEEMADAWSRGLSLEDFCMSIAGLLPIQHIRNWEDIKHHFDNEPCELDEINRTTNKPFASWSEYYEDDGYVADPCFDGIPDTLEIEWVYGANEFLSKSLEKEEA